MLGGGVVEDEAATEEGGDANVDEFEDEGMAQQFSRSNHPRN